MYNAKASPYQRKSYQNLSSHNVEIRNKMETNSNMTSKSKYTVTLEFTGTADNKQIEQEIITILKEKYLSKVTSSLSSSKALKSLSEEERSLKDGI